MSRTAGDEGAAAVTDAAVAGLTPTPAVAGPSALWRFVTRTAKRFLVLVVGVAVLLSGVTMLVLPGPGVLVIIVGLAILATEFAWAERALGRTTTGASRAVLAVNGSSAGRGLLVLSGLGLVAAAAVVPLVLGTGIPLGIGLGLAGVIALSTLTAPVQRWLERQQAQG